MSWFRTLAGPLQSLSAHDGYTEGESSEATPSFADARKDELEDPIQQGSPRGQPQEDISAFTRALSSKFWGVSSFLSPPSCSQTTTTSSSSSSAPRIHSSSSPWLSRQQQQEPTISGDFELVVSYESSRTAGICSDFAEIGGTLKTGIARISNNVTINEISKIAYNFLSLRDEEQVEVREEHQDDHVAHVVGVTDEVLAFARNIACHPETWLDFPMLSDDQDFFDDFDMSITQHDHALVIESLAPRLAALRIELCPIHMSIGCFWKIYFALLHPRLNKHDADLLSTPQVVEARAMLQHGLQTKAKEAAEHLRGCNLASRDRDDECLTSPDQLYTPGMLTNYWLSQGGNGTFSSLIEDLEMEKQSVLNSGIEFVDKFVVKEEPFRMNAKEVVLGSLEEEWPEDETEDVGGAGMAAVLRCSAEDISFSDLEDGDDSWNLKKKGLKLI